jgi:vacuolar protein sorting-associated protein 13A/C
VKYCSILLQALTIEADEDLLFSIYDLTQIKGASWERDTHEYTRFLLSVPSTLLTCFIPVFLLNTSKIYPSPRTQRLDRRSISKYLSYSPSNCPCLSCAPKELAAKKSGFSEPADLFDLKYYGFRLSLKNPLAVVLNAFTMAVGESQEGTSMQHSNVDFNKVTSMMLLWR